DSIRWLAISGIIVTSDPVRDRIVALTRSMSEATSSTRRLMEAEEGLSKGTMTAKAILRKQRTCDNRNARVQRQGRKVSCLQFLRWGIDGQGGRDRGRRYRTTVRRQRWPPPARGGAGALLQRGGGHRPGGRRFSCRAARGDRLCL